MHLYSVESGEHEDKEVIPLLHTRLFSRAEFYDMVLAATMVGLDDMDSTCERFFRWDYITDYLVNVHGFLLAEPVFAVSIGDRQLKGDIRVVSRKQWLKDDNTTIRLDAICPAHSLRWIGQEHDKRQTGAPGDGA